MNLAAFPQIQKNPAISDRVSLGTNNDQEISTVVTTTKYVTKGNDQCFADN